ncbi:hypothetical protein Tco_1047758, partial [Tanacetum coccineum]
GSYNHNTDAKDIWDNVKMLLEGSELTKDDRESQLYDEFKHFGQHKGENIHDYYVRLNQHSHDPLALVSNVSPYQYPSSSSVPPQPSYIPPGRQNRVQGNNARGVVAAGNGGAQYRAGNANAGQGKPIKCYNCNGIENGVDLDEEQLLFLAGGQTNTFDDETMFMAYLSSADPVYDEAGPSYDSDTLYEVQDHDNCLDNMNESHEEHEMHNDVQPNDVVDLDTEYTSNSNIISYEQYVQDNEDQAVHSDVSSVPNDSIMIITNDIYKQDA